MLTALRQTLAEPATIGQALPLAILVLLLAFVVAQSLRGNRNAGDGAPEPTRWQRFGDWLGIPLKTRSDQAAFAVFGAAYLALFILALLVTFALLGATLVGAELASGAPLGLGALLVALLGAPFLIWRSVVAQKMLDTTQHGQVTDRINKAVEGLGAEKSEKYVEFVDLAADSDQSYALPHIGQPRPRATFERSVPNMEVRVGAIHALGRIARENLNFHVQIMEILCAYVRENAPADTAKDLILPDMPEGEREYSFEAWSKWREAAEKAVAEFKSGLKPRTDIKTALEVLGRRTEKQKLREGGWPDPDRNAPCLFDKPFPPAPPYPSSYSPVADTKWQEAYSKFKSEAEALKSRFRTERTYRHDLRATNLQGYDLSDLDLRGTQFDGARMQGANLRGARMQGASLVGAGMQGANLSWTQMQGANLDEAQMQAATLGGAQMQGADLGEAEMQGADLGRAQMQGADLGGAQMQGAYLGEAQMQGANVGGAQMQGATLGWAEMQVADLDGAEMQGADLVRAQMQGAYLGWAEMQGASLVGAGMSEYTNVTAARFRGAAVRSVDLVTITQLRPFWDVLFADGTLRAHVSDDDWPEHWRHEELDYVPGPPDTSPFHIAWRAWQATLPPEEPAD